MDGRMVRYRHKWLCEGIRLDGVLTMVGDLVMCPSVFALCPSCNFQSSSRLRKPAGFASSGEGKCVF